MANVVMTLTRWTPRVGEDRNTYSASLCYRSPFFGVQAPRSKQDVLETAHPTSLLPAPALISMSLDFLYLCKSNPNFDQDQKFQHRKAML